MSLQGTARLSSKPLYNLLRGGQSRLLQLDIHSTLYLHIRNSFFTKLKLSLVSRFSLPPGKQTRRVVSSIKSMCFPFIPWSFFLLLRLNLRRRVDKYSSNWSFSKQDYLQFIKLLQSSYESFEKRFQGNFFYL